MNQFPLLASALGWACIAATAFCQQPTVQGARVRARESPAPAVVFVQAEQTGIAVESVTRKLIALMADLSEEHGVRSRAIRELSRFHTADAIGPLVTNLLFIEPDINQPGPLASFPAARALVHYGRPVYGSIWGITAHKCSDDYLHVLAFVLHSMDGDDVAIFRLKERLDDPQTAPLQAKNLKQLVAMMRELDFEKDWPNPAEVRRNLEKPASK